MKEYVMTRRTCKRKDREDIIIYYLQKYVNQKLMFNNLNTTCIHSYDNIYFDKKELIKTFKNYAFYEEIEPGKHVKVGIERMIEQMEKDKSLKIDIDIHKYMNSRIKGERE